MSRRFATTKIETSSTACLHAEQRLGLPLLDDALAQLECATVNVHLEGDHTIFVGRVERRRRRAPAPAPSTSAGATTGCPGRPHDASIPLSRPPVDDEIKQAVLAAIDSRQYVLGPQCRQLEAELAGRHRREARRPHQLGDRRALADAARPRREGGRRGPGAGAHGVPHRRGHLPRRGHAGLRGRGRVLHAGPVDAEAKATPRTVGILPVHLYGQPVDLAAVQDLASRLGLWLARGLRAGAGREWNGRRVGSFGRAAVFSFYPSKNLPGMGDGGAILTGDDELAARCRRLRDHGRLDKDVHARDRLQPALQRAAGRGAAGAPAAARRDERPPPGAGRALRARRSPACRWRCRTSGARGRHVYHLYRRAHAATRRAGRVPEGARASRPASTIRSRPTASPPLERFAPAPLPRTERLVDEILTLPMSAEPHRSGDRSSQSRRCASSSRA